jgi:D-lyxose ketol-isomerase
MKRSTVNNLINDAVEFIEKTGFKLPPFAFWSPTEWQQKGNEADEIRDNFLGWDITDFGSVDFKECGLLLFTIRNGNCHNSARYSKKYAEKIMIVQENQVTPMHFHWLKNEDIINRGGGNLILKLYKATEDELLSNETFSVSVDGLRKECSAGQIIKLTPGESICLEPHVYHTFHAESGKGPVMVGEVSDVNDDVNDNRFFNPAGRFPVIDEDVAPTHLLCNEYPPVT